MITKDDLQRESAQRRAGRRLRSWASSRDLGRPTSGLASASSVTVWFIPAPLDVWHSSGYTVGT